MLYVPKLAPEAGGGAACVCVISHAIGDGVALVRALVSKLCDQDEPDAVRRAAHAGRRTKPPQLPLTTRAYMFMYGVFEGMTAAFWRHDGKSPLKSGVTSMDKRIATSEETLDLALVKKVAAAIGNGCTVNDVLMANLTKCVRYFLLAQGGEEGRPYLTGKKTMRVQFPANLRAPGDVGEDEEGSPNNKWAFGLIELPLNVPDSAELIREVKYRSDLFKASPGSWIAYKSIGMHIKTMPLSFIMSILAESANIATIMASNVPGPQAPIKFAGVTVRTQYYFLLSLTSLYIGILSYNGRVSMSVNIDASVGVDPRDLTKHWKPSFDAMYADVVGSRQHPQ